MASTKFRVTKFTLLLLLAFLAAPEARAQDVAMGEAGVRLGGAIAHSKVNRVAILDFSGPGDTVSELGETLADDLSAAMAKSNKKIQVENRSEIEKQRQQYRYPLNIVLDPLSALLFAQDFGTQALVMGAVSPDGDNRLKVSLTAYRTDNGKGIDSFQVSFALSDGISALMAKDARSYDPIAGFEKYPESGMNGYSKPICVHCPGPPYTPEATAKNVRGVVELAGIVGKDGRIRDIRVVKRLPAGLTSQAEDTVKSWKLKPATGPDGQPAEVWQKFELMFGVPAP